ncbi:hypothetical protein [Occultella kanbiaonis]|uniref:hypothetical protein n=1 Tax=Occultella kanbiaonis TaxID=2675754 RepID=UPI0013D25947|nr:hypothetical protein [Occultella kanbiaonis]
MPAVAEPLEHARVDILAFTPISKEICTRSGATVHHKRSSPSATNLRCTRSSWAAVAGRRRFFGRWLKLAIRNIRISLATRVRSTLDAHLKPQLGVDP